MLEIVKFNCKAFVVYGLELFRLGDLPNLTEPLSMPGKDFTDPHFSGSSKFQCLKRDEIIAMCNKT